MLDKGFKPAEVENKIYKMWEEGSYFTPKIKKGKKPFSIVLPLPNANDPMHMGHALFAVEDIMVRYHRMKGEPTLWLPGGDHAGIETQFVFEKHLAKEGKSRFDFDRKTLYQMIAEFVEKNRDLNKSQMKSLGFSLDWTRYHYSLEPGIVDRVTLTFRKMHEDGLVYRAERLVNYCTRCGTAFSDLEINHVERADPLYYLKYGPFILATTRPETKFGDTAVAFHPGDERYEKYLGREIEIQGVNGPFPVEVVADEAIDQEFGTGIEKVTPAHDFLDYEIAKRHGLPIKKVIDLEGRLTEVAGRFAGLKVKAARETVVAAMQEMGLIDHIDENYSHNIAVCYRCGTTIEPMLLPQWYVRIELLANPAIEAVKKGVVKIVPKKRFEKMYFDWMENIKDWNISRQIVWGPRIPVWYCLSCNPKTQISFVNKEGERINGSFRELSGKYSLSEVESGLQSLVAEKDVIYQLEPGPCKKCNSRDLLQETDTFDTWFLSGQWPVNTLKSKPGDFEYFYPTSVLDTLWDILFFWVGRMMMFGLYLTRKVPFKTVHIHSRVVDREGRKMSKSKGNVLDPIVMVDQYGADALRMALVIGVAPASDIAISEEKIRGQRNFTNKIWNVARFVLGEFEKSGGEVPFLEKETAGLKKEDADIIRKLNDLIKSTTKDIEGYRFGKASENIYQFIWHEFADKYIELSKPRLQHPDPGSGSDNSGLPGSIHSNHPPESDKDRVLVLSVLRHILINSLKLLHPFMPFVTEAIWQKIPRRHDEPLIVSQWPEPSR